MCEVTALPDGFLMVDCSPAEFDLLDLLMAEV